jgi:D-glycero-alpha-D-manno-heptose-7-phosphate kinase
MRFLEFRPGGEVVVERVPLDPVAKRRLNENLMLFFTGVTRSAGNILDEQKRNINGRVKVLRKLKSMAHQARDELQAGNVDAMGELLHESWGLKKQLASRISNDSIDEIYTAARQAGATGGKITGAGGGGFLLLYCPHEKQDAVRDALRKLQELPFKLEHDGSKVIFNYHR